MEGRKRILLGLTALVCLVTALSIWQQAYRVSDFCNSLQRSGDMDSVVHAAREAGFDTWVLPETSWQGVRQHPIVVVQDGFFVCAVEARYGRVGTHKKWLERDFRARYPRRIAQAGRE